MRPINFTYAPTASSANNIALAQTTAGAANLVLNGSLVAGGVATLGAQQFLLFTTTSNVTAVNATITGTDKSGNTITETLSLPNTTTKASTKSFYTVTSIAVSGAVAANMTVGVNGLGYSQPYPLDIYLRPFSVSVAVTTLSASPPTYKAQYTYDDVFDPNWPNGTQVWIDSANMTGKSAAFVEALTAPVRAVRFVITTAASPQSMSGVILEAGV
jgi:hypothetical protein